MTHLLGFDTVCKMFGISKPTLLAWIARGWIAPPQIIRHRAAWDVRYIKRWQAAGCPAANAAKEAAR